MTVVVVGRGARGVEGLTVSGHADYAQSGQDIVCAAISTLVTTCANSLESVVHIQPRVRQQAKDAKLSVFLPEGLSPAQIHDAQIVFRTVLQGLEDLAHTYPDNLTIK